MFDAEPPDQEKPQRSLLSFGSPADSARRSPPRPSLLAAASEETPDPTALHRLARSRREATPNRYLAALSTRDPVPTNAAPAAEPAAASSLPRASLGERVVETLSNWFKRDETATEPPEVRTEARKPAPPIREEVAAYRPSIRQSAAEAPKREQREQPRAAVAAANNRDDQTWQPLIEPTSVISGVVNSKKLIVLTTLLGAVAGVMIALSTPKKYESAAELLIDPRDLQLVDRNLTEGGLPSDATLAIVENQVRVITSGSVLNKVVEKLKLDEDPEFNGQRSSFGISGFISWLRSLASPKGGEAGEGRRHALAVESLGESLSVERGGKTFVVVIAVKSESGEKSALIANTVTEVFLETYGKLQSDTAGRAAGELTARLDELRATLEKAERKVEAYKAEHDLIDAQGRLISDDEIVKLNEQLGIARAKTIELNAKASTTRGANVNSVVAGTLPEELSSSVMVELRSQYATLKREGDRAAAKLGPRHPERIAAESELVGLRQEIAAELNRIISSSQTELRRAVQLEQELAARLAQLKVRQGGVSDDLVTLRELEREASAKRAVYESYLLRARETGEQKDINTANMSVISQAFPPLEPTGPSRAIVSATGMIFGFGIGILLGALRGALASLRSTMASRRGNGHQRGMAIAEAPLTPATDSGVTADAAILTDTTPASEAPAQTKSETKPMFGLFDRSRRSAKEAAPPVPQATASLADAARTAQPAEAPMHPYPYPYPPQAPMYPQGAYPVQPQPYYGQVPYPHQPQAYATPQMYAPQPQMPVYPPQYAAPQQVYPQPYLPQHMMPVQHLMPQQPVMPQMVWAAAPQPQVYPYAAPAPVQAQPAPQRRETEYSRSDMEEVRDSLREFREAVLDLSDNRTRRRSV